jgi:hypothetical protein
VIAGAFNVLGPVIAERDLGGASSWGLILAAMSLGAVVGATLTLHFKPIRLLRAATLALPLLALPLFALSVPLAVPLIAAAAMLAGVGDEIFEVNWSTAIQQQIPPHLLSRVAAYDAFGSYALGPVGTTLAGPIALAAGLAVTVAAGGGVILTATLAVLFIRDVRRLARSPADTDADHDRREPPPPKLDSAEPAASHASH